MNKKIKDQLISIHQMILVKDYASSHKSIDKLLKKNTTSHELLNLKAYIYMSQGFWNESLDVLKKSNLFHPKIIDTYFNLGIVYENKNNFENAISSYMECINLNKNFVDPYIQIVRIHIQNFEIENALKTIDSLLKIDSNIEIAHHLAAQCYRLIHNYSKQEDSLKKSLTINSTNSANYVYLAFIKLWQHNIAEAKHLLLNAIEIDRNNTFAIFNLMEIDKSVSYFNDISLLNRISDSKNLNLHTKIYLNLCYANYFKNRDELKYISHLKSANNNKYQSLNFNMSFFRSAYTTIFNKYNLLKHTDKLFYKSDYQPIFIIGMPRSGSTLIEQIISNHPDIGTCGEVDLLNYELNKFLIDNSNDLTALKTISIKYLAFIKLITDKKIFIDKLPLNFMWIGFIKLIFPKAKFVVTKRNKFDTCFSIFKIFFGDNALPFAYNENEINEFYVLHEKFIQSWINVSPSNIFTIDYDKVIESPEIEISKLFDFLGFDFDKSYLNLNSSKTFIQTASFSQARNKIQGKSNYNNYIKFFPEFIK